MKSHNILTVTVISLLAFSFSITASANSIWNEKIENFSYTPYLIAIIIGTLILESAALILIPRCKKPVKIIQSVFAANAASFLIPRAFIALGGGCLFGNFIYTGMLSFGLSAWDFLWFLLTAAIELPILWRLLRNDVKSVKALLLTALAVNFITTIATAFINTQIENRLLS